MGLARWASSLFRREQVCLDVCLLICFSILLVIHLLSVGVGENVVDDSVNRHEVLLLALGDLKGKLV